MNSYMSLVSLNFVLEGYFKMSEYHIVLENLYRKYGPVVREDIGTETVIHVFDPDDVKTVHGVTGKTPEVPPLQKVAQLYRQKRNLALGLGNMYRTLGTFS